MNASTACIKAVRVCVLAAAQSGVAPAAAAARLGLDPALLGDPHARVPNSLFLRAWDELPAVAGDEELGLRAAAAACQQPFDIIDYVCAQVPTLREAIERMLRYQRLLNDDAELSLTIEGSEARLTMRLAAVPCAPRHFSEFVIATWILRARNLIGLDFLPHRASFQHMAPPDIEPHRRLFGSPLAFRESANGLTFARELLDAPVRSSDPALGVLLERHATELLGKLPPRDSIVHRVKAHLLAALPGELPPIEATARALGASGRTLQRTLQAEGTTYQAVGDEVRRDLSLGYLRDPQRTVSEIAFLLGFNEVAAFTRAFRRWTGEAPSAFRQRTAR